MDNSAVEGTDWRLRLGREIRAERTRLGWTQKDLAGKATPILYPDMDKEISTDTIHRIEHGDNTRTDMLHALAMALDVKIRVRLRPQDETRRPPDKSEPADPSGNRIPEPNRPAHPLLAHPPTLSNGEEMDPADPLERLAHAGDQIAKVGAEIVSIAGYLGQSWQPIAVDRRGGSAVPPRTRKARPRPRQKPAQKTSKER